MVKRRRCSREELITEFLAVKDGPGGQLAYRYARNSYSWFSSACAWYGKDKNDWDGALEKLYELHGGMTKQQAKQKVKEIRRAGKRGRKPKYDERQIAEKFLRIKDAPNKQLTWAYAQKNYDWFYSAVTHYGKKPNDWYGALEKLYELHGGMTEQQAKQKVEEIKQKLVKRGRKPKYTEWQITKKFLRIKDAPNERLTMAYAIERYKWRTSACTHCGKKPSDWYGLLEELFTRHGGMNKGQARIKVGEVRREASMQRSMRISITLKDRHQIHDTPANLERMMQLERGAAQGVAGTPANRERMRQFAGGVEQAQGRARLGGMQPPAISVRAKRVV